MPIKEAVLAEISREVPEQFKDCQPGVGRAGFTMNVYGCSVFEERTGGNRFAYIAVNNVSGKSEIIERRRKELPSYEDEIVKFALKVRASRVSGLGRLEVAEGVPLSKLKIIVRELFREILPGYGYKIREEQIGLAEELLDALTGRRTLIAEAPTGLGKTLVFIIVGALIKRSKINNTWNGGYYPGMSCVEWQRMPILVSTTSIALQTAIVTDYIPAISKILEDYGIIRDELTVLLRKGRSHHLCEFRLNEFMPGTDGVVREVLERLSWVTSIVDLGGVAGLTADVKDKISVLTRCFKNCPYADDCRYLAYRDAISKTGYDFVIGNHNLLLQDMKMRAEGERQTLPPVQAIILDESHSLLKVARDMYGSKLPADAIPKITQSLRKLNFAPLATTETDSWKVTRDSVYKLSDKLYETNKRLFSRENAGDECDLPLRNIRDFADLLHRLLKDSREFKVERDERAKQNLLWELQKISNAANELFYSDGMIRWFEAANDVRTVIGGVPKDLDKLIRTETDTGVVAILDCRANECGAYFQPVIAALPDCRVTSDIKDIEPFLRAKKPAEYWD
jgi:ATP-dependent DNA helicase DinG